MFQKNNEDGFKSPLPGIEMKTTVYGEKTLMAKFLLKKGSAIPFHAHPHEQTGFLVKGQLLFTIGDEAFDVREGDSWCIAGDVEHKVEVLEDSVVVEVFSPVREEYLPEKGSI